MTESALMINLIQYYNNRDNRDNDILMESNIFGNLDFSMNEDDNEEINCIQLQIETTNDINVNLCVFQKLEMVAEDLKLNLSQHSKTAKFRSQDTNYVNIMRTFIRASRTGDWHLYLLTLEKMPHLFAAMLHQLDYISRL